MRTRIKRSLALFLSIAVLLCIVPTAYAEVLPQDAAARTASPEEPAVPVRLSDAGNESASADALSEKPLITLADGMAASGNVAEIGTTAYATLTEAIEQAAPGETIHLLSDIELDAPIELTKSIIIDGTKPGMSGRNGDGCYAIRAAGEYSNRVINIDGCCGKLPKKLDLQLKNVQIIALSGEPYTRAVSAYAVKNLHIELQNVRLACNYYALNLASENENVTIQIDRSKLEGLTAINIWSPIHAEITDSILIGTNSDACDADRGNSYAAIAVNQDGTGSVMTFQNDEIIAETATGNEQNIVNIQGVSYEPYELESVKNSIRFSDCKFSARDTIHDEPLIPMYSVEGAAELYVDGKAIFVSAAPDARVYAPLEPVAEKDEVYYGNLSLAVSNAKSGDKITLLSDVTEDVTIPAGKAFTLDLNGKTLTNVKDHTIRNEGNLTITGKGTVDNVTHGKAPLYNTTTGTLTIENGTFTRSAEASTDADTGGGNSWYVLYNAGTVTIEDGDFRFSDKNNGLFSGLIVNGWPRPGENTDKVFAELTINGGTFTGGKITIKNDDYGRLTITDGTFIQPTDKYYCVLDWNEATIRGGVFYGDICATGYTTDGNYELGKLTVTDGCFNGLVTKGTGENDISTLSISGGYFTSDPSAYKAAGYYVAESDKPGYFFTLTNVPPIEASVVVSEKVEVAIPDDSDKISADDKSKIEEVIHQSSVSGVSDALKTEEKQSIIAAAGVTDTTPEDVVEIEIGVNVAVTDVNLSSDDTTTFIAFEVKPVATVKVNGTAQDNTVDVGNHQLDGSEITVRLPIPANMNVQEIKHTCADGSVEYFYKDQGNKRFMIEDGVAVLKITKFSELLLSGTITSAAMVNGESYPTLQAAIDAASSGDTIVLQPGVGSEKVSVRRKSLTIDVGTTGYSKDNISLGSRCRMSEDGSKLVLTYKKPSSSDSSSEKTYSVSAEKSKNGTVKLSDAKAVKGDTVTITVKPEDGYVLDTLTVIDADGDEAKLKDKGDGKYTFTMPASKITVEATFVLASDAQPTQPTSHPFADIAAGSWIDTAVQYVYANGLMTGVSETEFAPSAATNRAMIWTILARRSGADTTGGANWYEKGQQWAIENGISDGSNPSGSITREQLAVMLWRYSGSPAVEGSLDRFNDAGKVSGYAADAMRWAVETGLISGMGDGTLNPQGNATRAQLATILMRYCENLAK